MAINAQIPLAGNTIDTASPLADLAKFQTDQADKTYDRGRQAKLDADNHAQMTAQLGSIDLNNQVLREKLKQSITEGLDAREQSRLKSTAIAAAQLNIYLDSGDTAGAQNFLLQRKQALTKRMAHGENVDTQETDEALQLLQTNPDMLKSHVQQLMKFGQIIGALDVPKGTAPVTLSEGQTLVDPNTGKQIAAGQPKAPAGYQAATNADPNAPAGSQPQLQPIPGGPVDLKMKAAKQKQDQMLQDGIAKAQLVTNSVDEALGHINDHPFFNPNTGTYGWAAQHIGGTEAYNTKAVLDVIQANLGFDELQKMRAASPTGGALGQVSEKELNFLQSAVASLSLGQDEKQLKKHLSAVKEHYNNWLTTVKKAKPEDFQSVGDGADPNAAGATPYSGMSNEDLLKELTK